MQPTVEEMERVMAVLSGVHSDNILQDRVSRAIMQGNRKKRTHAGIAYEVEVHSIPMGIRPCRLSWDQIEAAVATICRGDM